MNEQTGIQPLTEAEAQETADWLADMIRQGALPVDEFGIESERAQALLKGPIPLILAKASAKSDKKVRARWFGS